MSAESRETTSSTDRFLVRWLVLPLLRVYRKVLSPVMYALGSRCRFYPSCSMYSMEAFQTHGVLRGFWLSTVRLVKCNPLHPGGVDPVPPAGHFHHHHHDHKHDHDHSAIERSDATAS